MIFSCKNKHIPNLAIEIDGELVNEVQKTKFLGVIIDKNYHGKSTSHTYQEKLQEALVW